MRGDLCPSFWCGLLAAHPEKVLTGRRRAVSLMLLVCFVGCSSWRNRAQNREKESCFPSYSSGVFCWLLILEKPSSELREGELFPFLFFWYVLLAVYPGLTESITRRRRAISLHLILVCFCWLLIRERPSPYLGEGELFPFVFSWCVLFSAYPGQTEFRTGRRKICFSYASGVFSWLLILKK
jgi:hypothetical protein